MKPNSGQCLSLFDRKSNLISCFSNSTKRFNKCNCDWNVTKNVKLSDANCTIPPNYSVSAASWVNISKASHLRLCGWSRRLLLFLPQFLLEEEIFQHILLQLKVSFHVNALPAQKKGSQRHRRSTHMHGMNPEFWQTTRVSIGILLQAVLEGRNERKFDLDKNLPHPWRPLGDFWGFLTHAGFLAHLSQQGSAAWLCRQKKTTLKCSSCSFIDLAASVG